MISHPHQSAENFQNFISNDSGDTCCAISLDVTSFEDT
jgi:hypothetical protein